MAEAVCAALTPRITEDRHAFSSVSAEELGFALNLFVAAANRTLMPNLGRRLGEEEQVERERFFADLLVHAADADAGKTLTHQASLESAFRALWDHFSSHTQRDALCARVLYFHFLMVKTEGRAVSRWTEVCPERAEAVLLHPAVVEGLANVPLDTAAGLVEAHLIVAITQAYAKSC